MQVGEHFRIRPWRGGSPSKSYEHTGTRFLSAIVIASVLLGVTGCGDFRIHNQGDADRHAAFIYCTIASFFGLYTIGPELKTCIDDNSKGAGLSYGELLSTTEFLAAPGVTQTGEALLAVYGTDGRVRATEFPELIVSVPHEGLSAAGADVVTVSVVSQVLVGGDLEPATELFDLMEVTLRTAEGDPVAEASAKFTEEEVAAVVAFEGVEPQSGLEAVISFAGGAVRDALVFLSAGATLPFADAGASSPAKQTTGEAPFSVPEGPGLESFSPAEVVAADSVFAVNGPTQSLLVFYRTKGSVKARKFPKIVLDLPDDGQARVDVDAGLSVLTEDFKAPKKKWRPKSVTATLLEVENGMTKKVGTSNGKVDKEGNASVSFEDIEPPENGHLRLVIRMKGKKLKNALIIGFGSAG